MSKVNLIGVPRAEILKLLEPCIDRPFRGPQVANWILQRHVCSFDEMTDLPLSLRDQLAERFSLQDPQVAEVQESRDGARKYLLKLADGILVEGVAMPEESKVTLCLSTQAGCALGCTFCVTGVLGPGRNLTPDEIVGQYRVMIADQEDLERVNIVMMGMGEPLLNTVNLGVALDVLNERVSPKRITISTAGIIPGIRWLADRPRPPKLAVSLNAPDQERRARIMPIARRFPLPELIAELRRFPLDGGRRITFEYVLISGFNDDLQDARTLAQLLSGIPSKVNLIPLNPDARTPDLQAPDEQVVDAFAGAVRDAGLVVTVRRSRGSDIQGACGQLRGKVAVSPGAD
jgi:23S rRNA (adenine2503-C2)-methyltransferase